jgi:hypothetical protein
LIELKQTKTFNFEGAIRGMRNPMNSWEKSDSKQYWDGNCWNFHMGEEDLRLARKLIKAGSDHRKFIRQLFISVDINAPLYWWKEFDTYKVGTVANSCSTMHKIHSKPITKDDFSIEQLSISSLDMFYDVISHLESLRTYYLETKDKKVWYNIIQLLPESYNQTRTVTMNYENVLNMYRARKNHKLDEWHTFCDWIEELPYFKELFLEEEQNEEA